MTVRESEFNASDRARLLDSWQNDHAQRGSHGVLIKDATNPLNNPYDPRSTGRFVAEPVADFAQLAIDNAKEARRKVAPEDDFPLLWQARLEPK